MKNMIKEFVMKNKYVIITIFLLVSILIGGTYAWLRIEIFGTKTNRIDIGSLSLELNEDSCDGISVVNGVPVTDMSGMFVGSTATTLDVSNFDTSKVTNMSGMFRYSEVTTLDLSGFDTSNVINMSEIFYDSVANPIYVKDQAMLDRFVADGSADGSRLQIK